MQRRRAARRRKRSSRSNRKLLRRIRRSDSSEEGSPMIAIALLLASSSIGADHAGNDVKVGCRGGCLRAHLPNEDFARDKIEPLLAAFAKQALPGREAK